LDVIARDQNVSSYIVNVFKNNYFAIKIVIVMIVAIIIKMQHNTNKQLFKLLLVMRMALTLRTKKNKIMNKKMLLV
jgi:hypothetical protein